MTTQTIELSPVAITRILNGAATALMAQRDEQFDTFTPLEQDVVRRALMPYVKAIVPATAAEVQRALQEAATDLPVASDTIEGI